MTSNNRRASFIAEVAVAVRDSPRLPRHQSASQIDALKRSRAEDPLRGVRAAQCAPRCCSTNRTGRPCMAPAMRGTDRCAQHGGRMRAGPRHRGNQLWMLSGKAHRGLSMQATRTAGQNALGDLTREELSALWSALGTSASGYAVAAAALALVDARMNEGSSWVEWLKGNR